MLYGFRQVGHQDFVWELRKDPRIVRVFEAMWGTSELLTSFDGWAIAAPYQAAPCACSCPSLCLYDASNCILEGSVGFESDDVNPSR